MNLRPVVRKELQSYFNSPIAYIVILFFLEFTAVWFLYIQHFLYQNVASMQSYFAGVPIVFTITLPALTMRSWAEERKMGTYETLMTLPFRDGELVVGKFLAAFLLVALLALLSVPLPLTLSPLGNFQLGPIIGEYLGMLFLGAAGIAVGQFTSALSANQISAYIVAVVVLLAVTLLGSLNAALDLPTWIAGVLNYVSFGFHFESFDRGIVDSRDVLYFALLTFVFLYLNTRVIAGRRWS